VLTNRYERRVFLEAVVGVPGLVLLGGVGFVSARRRRG